MKSKKTKSIRTLIVITGINLIFSTVLAQDNKNVTGNIQITECEGLSCMKIRPPGDEIVTVNLPNFQIVDTKTKFLDNAGSRLLLITNTENTDVRETRLKIEDSRESGAFNISLKITNLINQTDNTKFIPCTNNIGIMSFNKNENEAISLDSTPADSTVRSLIDPDIFAPDGQNQTYEEIIASPNNVPSEWITWLNESCTENIVTATENHRKNTYTMGLAFFIRTPPNPSETLKDGKYEGTATFTLTI